MAGPSSPEKPASGELFLYGVDLFNYGYWWEAHAAWERLWKAAPAADLAAVFLQGLIQLSAALVKWRAGATRGAARLGGKGLEKLGRVAAELGRDGESRYLGVDVARFSEEMSGFLEGRGGSRPPLLRVE